MSDDDRRGLHAFFSIYVCDYDMEIAVATSIAVVFFIVSLAGVAFMDPNAKSYPIAVVNAVILGGFTLFFGSLAVYCARQDTEW